MKGPATAQTALHHKDQHRSLSSQHELAAKEERQWRSQTFAIARAQLGHQLMWYACNCKYSHPPTGGVKSTN